MTKIEEYLTRNVNDLMTFEKIKILIQNYYSQKNFDLENEINVLLVKNLGEKLKEMKNEFIQIKNEKLLSKNKLEKYIADISMSTRGITDKYKYEKELNQRQSELERINNEISLLELNCKKKETLFNKYIIVLRNKCKKSSQESYYEMNPAIVIETEFEDKLKEEVLRTIDFSDVMIEEEKIKNKNLVEIYFKDLIYREKQIQSLYIKKKKTDENNEILIKSLEKLEENITLTETDIANKKPTVNNLTIKEKILFEKIQSRSRNLTSNLEQLGEIEFGKYLKSNDMVLSNMKRIYGNKVLDKVFKVQKQKILESIIIDHSYKKSKINEFLNEIYRLEQRIDSYNNTIIDLDNNYKNSLRKFEDLIDFKNIKRKENNFLEESKHDLKEKIELTMENQLKELENEKAQLQFKFNLGFFIEKAKTLGANIERLRIEREKYKNELENFRNIINEKEKKLYLEVILNYIIKN